MSIKTKLKNIVIQSLRENKDEYETDYVEYVRDLPGEEPFLIGGKKYQYVLAKYPSGKRDIGVYAFSGDVVHGYNYFRRMYGIRESLNEIPDPKKQVFFIVREVDLSVGSRDPDAEREVVYRIFRVTTDPMGDKYEEVPVGGRDYYSKGEAEAVAHELNKKIGGMTLNESVERFSKTVNGTINVNGEEFDYVATVSGNVVGMSQPHGEFYSEIDETSVDVEIENITPEPTNEQWKKIDSAVYDDVMKKNLWDFVNENTSSKNVCFKCKREILPSETIYRTPMSNLVQHIPSCPTDAPLGEKPHERKVRLGKLKESGEQSTKPKKVTIVFEIKMDNFFEDNAHIKANDMVFWAIQQIGLFQRHKFVGQDRVGEYRFFKFEVTLDNKDQAKELFNILKEEHHVKKLVVLTIKEN